MTRFTIHSITGHGALGLSFELATGRLICLGEADAMPDAIVQAFDPRQDIFYSTPAPLTPHELEVESEIHVPPSLRDQIDRRLLASTLGASVLMQFTEKLAPAISPLSALTMLLEQIGSVNAALLEANNGGIVWAHRAAEHSECNIAAAALTELVNASTAERQKILADFGADTIVVSGSDVDHFEPFDFGDLTETRTIALADFAGICDFTEDASRHIGEAPHYFTLAIGAAAVYKTILQS
jgi:hypothetical protein